MPFDEAKNYLTVLLENNNITINEAIALEIAIKSLEAWEDIDRELKTIMEGDNRTFKNQITEDGLYYDGIYKAIKIINKHLSELGVSE